MHFEPGEGNAVYCMEQQNHWQFNPNKPNGLSYPYTLGESICQSRGVRCIFFQFCSICMWNSCKQTVKTLIRCRLMRRLIKVWTVCLCPTKGTPDLYGLKFIRGTPKMLTTAMFIGGMEHQNVGNSNAHQGHRTPKTLVDSWGAVTRVRINVCSWQCVYWAPFELRELKVVNGKQEVVTVCYFCLFVCLFISVCKSFG